MSDKYQLAGTRLLSEVDGAIRECVRACAGDRAPDRGRWVCRCRVRVTEPVYRRHGGLKALQGELLLMAEISPSASIVKNNLEGDLASIVSKRLVFPC